MKINLCNSKSACHHLGGLASSGIHRSSKLAFYFPAVTSTPAALKLLVLTRGLTEPAIVLTLQGKSLAWTVSGYTVGKDVETCLQFKHHHHTSRTQEEAKRGVFFFLIIPSYSNFTNSVNLYNTSESETYKKSAGNI